MCYPVSFGKKGAMAASRPLLATSWGGPLWLEPARPQALTMLFQSAMAISACPRSEKWKQSSEKKVRSASPLCDQRQGHYLPGTGAPLPAPAQPAGGLGISPFILSTLLVVGSDIDEESLQF